MNAPIIFAWDGEAMVPLKRFAAQCDRQFAVHATYPLVVHEHRSKISHDHFFVTVDEAWKNLPERIAESFATADHLRKWCLIKAGFRDERSIVCASKAEAQRVSAFVKPMDEFAVVLAKEAVVTVYTAKSQSMRAMGKADFQASKQAVLDVLASMIGVEKRTLEENAGKAA